MKYFVGIVAGLAIGYELTDVIIATDILTTYCEL